MHECYRCMILVADSTPAGSTKHFLCHIWTSPNLLVPGVGTTWSIILGTLARESIHHFKRWPCVGEMHTVTLLVYNEGIFWEQRRRKQQYMTGIGVRPRHVPITLLSLPWWQWSQGFLYWEDQREQRICQIWRAKGPMIASSHWMDGWWSSHSPHRWFFFMESVTFHWEEVRRW